MFGRPGYDDKGWGLTTLGECCELNPRRSQGLDDELEVSFLAMPSVSEDGHMDTKVIRHYSEVKKGFTYFAEKDVLFAKITPCMENGKGAVAEGLSNGIGAGSTEFHVLRPIPQKSNPHWLYIITMFDAFRINARKVMTGTGGQLRVPIGYLKDYPITLPPIELQNEFEMFYRQSDKSKFNGFKSQFIEMFGDPDKVISETEYKVSDVADVQVGLVIKPTRFYSDVPTPYPAFRSLNVGPMEVRDSDWIYFTEKGMEENQRTIAHTGDVLVVRSGYPGTSCVVTPEYDGRNVVDLIIAHPDTSKILPEFLCAYTNFPHGKMQIEANQRGVAQKHFNVLLYNSMKIVVPDLDKQHEFVKILKQSDKSK